MERFRDIRIGLDFIRSIGFSEVKSNTFISPMHSIFRRSDGLYVYNGLITCHFDQLISLLGMSNEYKLFKRSLTIDKINNGN